MKESVYQFIHTFMVNTWDRLAPTCVRMHVSLTPQTEAVTKVWDG